MSVAACLLIGNSQLQLGLIFLILTATSPFVRRSGRRGRHYFKTMALFDSTADRVTDGLLLCGVAWHLADTKGGTIMTVLPMAVLLDCLSDQLRKSQGRTVGLRSQGRPNGASRTDGCPWIWSCFESAIDSCALDHTGSDVCDSAPRFSRFGDKLTNISSSSNQS